MIIERIIELLEIEKECVLRNATGGCNRYCAKCDLLQDDTELHEMYTEVIALLQAQEPRVMTLDEALNSLVIEYRSGKLREVGKHVFAEGFEYYGDLWRVWDRMPTDERRRDESWQQ